MKKTECVHQVHDVSNSRKQVEVPGSYKTPGQIFEEVARVHGRKKLLESTEGRSHSSPQKEEAAQVHRRRKLLESTEGGRCSSPQKKEAA